ncbi:MAG: response regulator transcription factor [Chloroflexi bacterium]|nr:response regulator transcription factor [Chloroflexota bacterium]
MKNRQTILVIDDDPELCQVLGALLESEGFQARTALNASAGLQIAKTEHPDLIVLDIMMPGMDGRAACRHLRQISNVPILMLTALSDQTTKINSLNEGADDYLSKPFDNLELIARLRALLRRAPEHAAYQATAYDDGNLKINFDAQQIWLAHSEINLTPTEWRLLANLVRSKGRVVPYRTLLRNAWGENYAEDRNLLKVHITHLRHKIGDDAKKPRYIHSVRESGYRFAALA